MKRIAKFGAGLLAAVMLTGAFGGAVFAAGDANVVIGDKLNFEEGNEPFIAEERTMMPLRAISEALDATVYWFNDEKRVQIVRYDMLLSLQIGNNIMGKYKIENGVVSSQPESVELDVAAMIHNDRTYVPLRAISEAFNARISWDNPNRSAIIIPMEQPLNNMTVSEMSAQPDGTLCAVYGVIGRDNTTGLFYLRSLTKNASGEYSKISFCTPVKTSMSDNTGYGEYVSQYWLEQFGTENPSGMVVRFTGLTASLDGVTNAVLNKTTTGVKPLGYYDNYMKSLGLDFEPFDTLITGDAPVETPEEAPVEAPTEGLGE